MKRFLIHVSTYWCGMDDTFRAVAESEMGLWDLAEQLAYDNFQSYSCENDIAEEEGYDPDEMEESDWDELWSRVDESTYYSFSIEECEDDEEWNEYSGEIYGEDKVLQQRVPIKYCTEVPNSKDSSFVIMDFMGKSLLCAWRNNNTCKVGMPFLCRRIIKKGKSGFMYKNKFYSLETKYGWVF